MIIDAQQLFTASTGQALTATADSTNIIDLLSDRDIGVGEPMAVVLDTVVAADFTSGNETYQIDVETDDNSGFASATGIARRIPAAALLPLGGRMVIPLPNDNERYLRLNFTLGGTTPTWTVVAHLQPMSMIQNERYYPDALTIS